MPTNGHVAAPRLAPTNDDAPPAIESADDVAGISDLRESGAKLEWVWPGWIQRKVVTLIASEGGTGKTRLAADLTRRVRHQLTWPSGEPIEPHNSPVVSLWVVSDNHHGEMVTLTEKFGIDDCVKVNASRSDPYDGVNLETVEDFYNLEQRVKVCRPLFVFVDTVGNSTDRNLSKQEDAKSYYQPLQILARRQNVAVICLTHLNAGGSVLGRRGTEKVRTLIRMTAQDIKDSTCRRRLEVVKSNSIMPPAVGITMGELGNEYDDNPPPPPMQPGESQPKEGPTEKVGECMDWLSELLRGGPVSVGEIRKQAEAKGWSSKTLYKAKEALGLVESVLNRRKFWCLSIEPDDEDSE